MFLGPDHRIRFFSGIRIFVNPIRAASEAILSGWAMPRSSPVRPISPRTMVWGSAMGLPSAAEEMAVATARSMEVPSGRMPPATFTYTSLLISFAALVLDVLILETVTRTRGLKEIRTAIENQWRKQKHFTPEHDHEVNLYRGTVRVTQQYPRHIVAMAAAMLVLSVFL